MIDAQGMTPMQRLVEGHAHLTFRGAQRNTDLGDTPPEAHTIATLHNANTLLVDGEPLRDVRVLQDARRLCLIMKNGAVHKIAPTLSR